MSALRIPAFQIEHGSVTYEAEVAVVDHFTLSTEDHGLFVADVSFGDGGGWHQGLPGRALDTYDKALDRRVGTAFGMDLIMAIVGAIGSPENAKGRRVVVLRKRAYGLIEGFAPLQDDGTIGDLVIPQEIADRHYPNQDES